MNTFIIVVDLMIVIIGPPTTEVVKYSKPVMHHLPREEVEEEEGAHTGEGESSKHHKREPESHRRED